MITGDQLIRYELYDIKNTSVSADLICSNTEVFFDVKIILFVFAYKRALFTLGLAGKTESSYKNKNLGNQ